MKKRLKLGLLGGLLALASLLVMAGCSLNKTADQIKTENNLNASVTYYANGGMFNNVPLKKEVTLWMDASVEAYPFDIPSDNDEDNADSLHQIDKGSMQVSRKQFIFDGWYHAVIDENTGKPAVSQATGSMVTLEENLVDFSVPLAVGDRLHLVAKWTTVQKVEIHLVADVAFTATVESISDKMEHNKDSNGTIIKEEKTVQNGDVIGLKTYSTRDNTVKLDGARSPAENANGATFLAYYFDEACTQPVLGEDLTIRPTDGEGNRIIYAKFITGDWTVIRDKYGVSDMFQKATGNYYLFADVDMGSTSVNPRTEFGATLQGNGYSIKNLKVAIGSTQVQVNGVYAVFGKLTATAKISNLTLENMSFNVESNPSKIKAFSAYFFCTGVESGAVLKGVTIKGGSMSVLKAVDATIANISWIENGEGGSWEASNYLFGGTTSDEAFLATNTGVRVETAPTLTIEEK